MTVIGTILLCFGMGLCARLIETTTDEHVFHRVVLDIIKSPGEINWNRPGNQQRTDQKPNAFGSPIDTRMYWVQPGSQSIGDQIFDPFAYSDNRFPLRRYMSSRKDTRRDSSSMTWIWITSVTTSTGFICQFLGLRACHSSVAVAQFGATILMSLVRASLRTQRLRTDDNLLRNNPDCFQGNELDFLALNIAQSPTSRPSNPEQDQLGPVWWVINASPFGDFDTSAAVNPDIADAASDPAANARSSKLRFLEKLPSVPGCKMNLYGFRIKEAPASKNGQPQYDKFLPQLVEEELSLWKRSEHCIEHETQCDPTLEQLCKNDFNAAIKACFYRGRLARLTGLEQPKSEHSSYWGEQFVPVRETAIALALAIEDTMQILFDSRSTDPVSLLRPWQQAFSIFWMLRCSYHDRPQAPGRYSDLHMSLRRNIDRKGEPEGSWKADRSEIESVLGLWSLSFKSLRIEGMQPRIRRILSAHPDMKSARMESLHLDSWREAKSEIRVHSLELDVSDIDATQHSGGSSPRNRRNRQENKPSLRCIENQNACGWAISSEPGVYPSEFKADPDSYDPLNRTLRGDWMGQFFGWCNIMAEGVPPGNKVVILAIASKDSIVLNCAQEIYSTFLAAVTQIFEHIGTSSAVKHQGTLTGKASNENVKRIQEALIARGLCDEEAAFACTIPVFQRLGKLKLPDELLDRIGEMVDQHRSENE